MAVEFRLLGDIETRINDQKVDTGPARRRCVLVVLLIEANHGVSVDQLIDRVWADRPPQRAREVLYSYLSRLRQTLSVTTDARIDRQGGGYVLTVDPTVVDLHRFHQLMTRARAADDDETAVALFEEALGLWRGSPFATLDTPWVNSVRNGLVRHRLAAELDRNDLALRHGDHGRLLVDLSAAAAAHPLDERLTGQLMLALYRSGRQGDAFEVYRQMRRRLADELGVDPGPLLEQLHQQILNTDPSLVAPRRVVSPPSSGSRGSSIPRQLPVSPRSFTGRSQELAQLDALLTAGERPTAAVISAVSGTAGIGKTALALHWAQRAATQFPDGQLYVNLRGFDPTGSLMDPTEAVRRFLDALQVPPERIPVDLDAQAALYRSQMADRRMLVLLDNARDSAQVRPLLPAAPTCLVLVTSRNQLSGLVAADGAQPIDLDLLSVDEAHELLAQRLSTHRLAAEPDAVAEIVTRCARLPLALALVAARAAARPRVALRALAGELADAGQRWATLTGDDPHTDVRAVFSWSYHALTPAAARLFRLLGLHPGPDITAPAAASLAGIAPDTVRPLLAELARASLLTEPITGRYTQHDLMRDYATQLADTIDTDEQRHTAINRILDHYLHTAHAAERLLDPARDPIPLAPPQAGVTPEQFSDHDQGLEWFAAERPALLAAVACAAASGFDTHTWQLAWTMATFLDRRGHWHDLVAVEQAAVTAAQRLADPAIQARNHRILATAYTQMGRLDDAFTQLRLALDLATRTGDQLQQAHTHHGLGYLWERRGQPKRALHHARQALHLCQATGDDAGQAHALSAVGWCHTLLGEHQQALTCCQQALTLHQKLGDRYGEAATWDSLGYAHHRLGQHTQAVTCYQRALTLYRDLGDRYPEATALIYLGDMDHAIGHTHAARDAWQEALTILDDLGHPDAAEVRVKLSRATTSEPMSRRF